MKVGMAPMWDEDLGRVACTILHVEDCQVVQVKALNSEESLLQVGAGKANVRRLKKPQKGHFEKAGVEPKRNLCEFRVTKDAELPPGTCITAQHFVPGQRVDVRGRSVGKGFQGGMKRWGFAGQGASHGVSKTHRHIGSTGQSQDAGKVFKGKKMPGQMGNRTVTKHSLVVQHIDEERNLIYLRGSVPGSKGNYVQITDTKKFWKKGPAEYPFPTFFSDDKDTSSDD